MTKKNKVCIDCRHGDGDSCYAHDCSCNLSGHRKPVTKGQFPAFVRVYVNERGTRHFERRKDLFTAVWQFASSAQDLKHVVVATQKPEAGFCVRCATDRLLRGRVEVVVGCVGDSRLLSSV
jgi:hypothetical protein